MLFLARCGLVGCGGFGSCVARFGMLWLGTVYLAETRTPEISTYGGGPPIRKRDRSERRSLFSSFCSLLERFEYVVFETYR